MVVCMAVWCIPGMTLRSICMHTDAPGQIMRMDCCGMLRSLLFRESGIVLVFKKKTSDCVNLWLFQKVFGVRAVSLRYCTDNTSVSLNLFF